MRKKHPKLFKTLVSLGVFVALWSVLISTDAILAANEKPPLFAIQVNDGVGSRHAVYIGLFYVVYVYDLPSSCIPEDPDCTIERTLKVDLHNWFYPGDGIM